MPKAKRQVYVRRRILGSQGDRHTSHGRLSFAGPDQLDDRRHLHAESDSSLILKTEPALRGIKQIRGDHRIPYNAAHGDAMGSENGHVIFDVVPDLYGVPVFQPSANSVPNPSQPYL